jgi:hypothetical protein
MITICKILYLLSVIFISAGCIITESLDSLIDPIGGKSFWARDFSKKGMPTYQIATLYRGSSKHADLYVEIPSANYINESLSNKILTEFEQKMWSREVEIFGKPMDVNHNKKITLIIMNIRDNWSGQNDPYVGGYFDPYNQFDDKSIHNDYGFRSNEREIIYLDSYPLLRLNPIKRFLSTLAHEFQHLLHFSRDYENYEKYGCCFESVWVNEGLSEIASLIAGYEKYQEARLENFRLDWHLTHWETTLEDYSSTYIFFRWLTDNYGFEILGDIIKNKESGVDPVGNAIRNFDRQSENPLYNYSNISDKQIFNLAYIDWLLAVMDKGTGYFNYKFSYEDFQSFICNDPPGEDCVGYADNPLLFAQDSHKPEIEMDSFNLPDEETGIYSEAVYPYQPFILSAQVDTADPDFDPVSCMVDDNNEDQCIIIHSKDHPDEPDYLLMFHTFEKYKDGELDPRDIGVVNASVQTKYNLITAKRNQTTMPHKRTADNGYTDDSQAGSEFGNSGKLNPVCPSGRIKISDDMLESLPLAR